MGLLRELLKWGNRASKTAAERNRLLNEIFVIQLSNPVDAEPADFSGHTISVRGCEFEQELPDDLVVEPGQTFTIHAGKGTDDSNHVFLGVTDAPWDSGDVVEFTDPAGDVVYTGEVQKPDKS